MKDKLLSVVFDDCTHIIDVEDVEIICLNTFEYHECVAIALNKKQQEDYICNTERVFYVSQKSIDAVNNYLSDTKNNVWRKKIKQL